MSAARPREPHFRTPDPFLIGVGVLAIGIGAGLPHSGVIALGIGCCICGMLIGLWRKRRSRRDEPFVSLVLLESEPRFLDAHILACLVDSAWGTDLAVADDSTPYHVTGEAPAFIVRTPEADFLVNVFDNAYWESTDEVLPYVSDLRTQRALAEHIAWLSIDLLQCHGETTLTEAYGKITRLAAELARSSTRALLDPASGAVRAWDDELATILIESRTVDIFTSRRNAPVVEVPDDDPVMGAAVAEARRRWPEFAKAFSSRHPEQHFSVKAPVTRAGHTEHIWIEVASIRNDEIRGRLGNDPVDLGGMKLGDPLSVQIADVEDWLYVLTDRPIGGFTIPAATSAPKRTKRARRE